MTDDHQFPHESLEAYRVALRLSAQACELADTIPRGRRKLADQLVRAATSTPLLVAEGANRVSRPDKAHKYTEARSEAAECGAGADVAQTQKVGHQELAVEVLSLARRAGSLLTGLIAKNSDEEWARRYRGEL